jgi:hypothetical protein
MPLLKSINQSNAAPGKLAFTANGTAMYVIRSRPFRIAGQLKPTYILLENERGGVYAVPLSFLKSVEK